MIIDDAPAEYAVVSLTWSAQQLAEAGRRPGEPRGEGLWLRPTGDRHGVVSIAIEHHDAFARLERIGHCTVVSDDGEIWAFLRRFTLAGDEILMHVEFTHATAADRVRSLVDEVVRALVGHRSAPPSA